MCPSGDEDLATTADVDAAFMVVNVCDVAEPQGLLSSPIGSDPAPYSKHSNAVATSSVTHGRGTRGGVFLNNNRSVAVFCNERPGLA